MPHGKTQAKVTQLVLCDAMQLTKAWCQPKLPWRVRRQLRRLGRCWRPVIFSSGVKEWSDGEVARLRRPWMKTFLHRHVVRCAFLVLLYVLAFAFLAASFERYWHWIRTLEAVASQPVKTVDRWKAYCAVKPWTKSCQTARSGPPAVGNLPAEEVAGRPTPPPPLLSSSSLLGE